MTALTIRQLEAPRNVLVLAGRAVPLAGFTFPVRQRGEARWFPGSDVGSVQLQGGQEEPTELAFRWATRRMTRGDVTYNGSPLTDADELIDVMEAMTRASVLVSVDWRGRERIGWISEFAAPEGKPGDFVDVRLEIGWIRAATVARKPTLPTPRDTGNVITELQREWHQAMSKAVVPATVARSALADAERAVNEINAAFRASSGLISEYREGVRDVGAIKGGMAAVLDNLITSALTLRDTVDEATGTFTKTDDPATQIKGWLFQSSLRHTAESIRRKAAIARRRQLLAERSDIIGIHVAASLEDLALVAFRYYGRAEVWPEIARFNDLPGRVLDAGREIMLPLLDAGLTV